VHARLVTGLLAGALVLAGCASGGSHAAATGGATQATSPASAGDLPLTTSPSHSASPTGSPATTKPSHHATPSRTPTPSTVPTQASPTPSSTPTQAVVTGSQARYVFPVRCHVSYGHYHHDYPATDIFAAVGCPVVSPVTGVIDEVSTVDRWNPATNLGATRGGLSFSVVGVDGVRYYGSHLSVLESWVRPGVHVRAGQLVGRVGHSGDARYVASHLHFGISWPTGPGIWWVRRGEVYPWPYLDAWRAGVMRSPAAAVAARHREVGDRGCTVDC
jgi:murein DD-endopeptidase MepM/ murein hydrolase activator NlpD